MKDHTGRRHLEETVVCLVRGPASRYPRGFIWLIPAWFAILAGAILVASAKVSGKVPLWLGLTEIGGLLLAATTAASVLVTARHRSFYADSYGIWLGRSSRRKRPKLRMLHLAWPEIEQLRMVPRRYGVLLEITPSQAARLVYWPGPGQQALLLLGALIMPIGFGRGRPGLTTPSMDPPRYLVKICDRSATDLKLALAAVKPETLPVRVLMRKGALHYMVPPPRKPSSGRPASPVA